MDNFKENLKVSVDPVEKSKSVELILQYIEKEKEINKEFDRKDGIDVDSEDYKPEADATIRRIMNLLDYREIRTEQAYLSKVRMGDNSRSNREIMAKIDKDRRDSHNLALSSFKGLNEFAIKNNMEPLYKGKMLSEEEIKSHDPSTYDIRMQMTDVFLNLLKELGDYTIRDYPNQETKKDIENIQGRIYKFERDYGITQELLNDDGDILFKDTDERAM